MTVIANKIGRSMIMSGSLVSNNGDWATGGSIVQVLKLMSGTMPASIANLTKAQFLADYSGQVLASSTDVFYLTWDAIKNGFEAITLPPAFNGIADGTATWFYISRYADSLVSTHYAISDSLVVSGQGSAMLELSSLNTTLGTPISVIDFSLGTN